MKAARAVYHTLSTIVYPIFLAKIKTIEGLEHLPSSGGFLLAANHIDWLDGFFIAAAVGEHLHRPVFFLTKSNNYWWTTLTIQIPPSSQGAIIDTAVDQVRQGRIVCNFPEGVRNTTKKLMPGKTGTARMALLAGVPVVPLGISCDGGKTMAQSLLYLASKDHSVTLTFGRPITLGHNSHPTPEQIKRGTTNIMSAIAPLAGKSFAE